MVSNSTLAAICVRSGFHNILIYDSPALGASIQEYVDTLEVAKQNEERTAYKEGRSTGQYWSEVEPPKVK